MKPLLAMAEKTGISPNPDIGSLQSQEEAQFFKRLTRRRKPDGESQKLEKSLIPFEHPSNTLRMPFECPSKQQAGIKPPASHHHAADRPTAPGPAREHRVE